MLSWLVATSTTSPAYSAFAGPGVSMQRHAFVTSFCRLCNTLYRYRLTASARMVVGLSQLPARRRGTHCQHTFVMWRTAPLHLDDYLKLIGFLSTSVYSALGVSAIMRYINRRFTYLLTSAWAGFSILKHIFLFLTNSKQCLKLFQIPSLVFK